MTRYIGIDVGKHSLHIHLRCTAKSFDIENSSSGFKQLIKKLLKTYHCLVDTLVVFEPTGGYENNLKEFLSAHNVPHATVHPTKVRAYAKAKGWQAKTDPIDAKLLAQYAETFSVVAQQDYSTPSQKALHALLQRRQQLLVIKNQEISRQENEQNQYVIQSLMQHISYLNEQLQFVQNEIDTLCLNDQILQSKINQFISIPGVGTVLATTVLCELPEIAYLELPQLTALVGLAPYARESGSYKGKRSIFAGRAHVRKILYMATVASLRSNRRIKVFYDRLIQSHKPPKVALIACMRKLLSFMHALFKNNCSWNPQFT